jgi:hypothetical protein
MGLSEYADTDHTCQMKHKDSHDWEGNQRDKKDEAKGTHDDKRKINRSFNLYSRKQKQFDEQTAKNPSVSFRLLYVCCFVTMMSCWLA